MDDSSRGAATAAVTRPPGMAWVPGATFTMGSDRHYPEEAPAHAVTVEGLWMDVTPVTNAAFRRFVEATGHVTLAERAPTAEDYPGADPALLVAGSAVFRPPAHPVPLDDAYAWWAMVPGASWRHPRGPQSGLRGLDDHPVVHVAPADAEAYCQWAGTDLPTEADWERAAWAGATGTDFPWGDELRPGGRAMANTWEGEFPHRNARAGRHPYTTPVRSYPPDAHGLFDMIGNVWEWTATTYADHPAPAGGCCGEAAGRPARDAPAGPVERRAIKGGSHLCAPTYCRRYRPAARLAQPVDTTTSHLGFRCVLRPVTSPGDGGAGRAGPG
jgi:formylglycine-generating enzyme required for sulfatase activity